MTAARKARCFIAMAFDHGDTDELYEKSIFPVLKANDVIPVVINRREDNRDINQQIIEQLESCDFCIADLTYTRPSVYFEAGYAQRSVEVIYTVRVDHLRKNQPEDQRVHFDLQMKPLIRWSVPDDASFRAKLEKRLRATVLREWSRTQAAQEREQEAHAEFSAMSIEDRLSHLFKMGLNELGRHGFRQWHYLEFARRYSNYQLFDTALSFSEPGDGWWVSTWSRGQLLHVATIHIAASVTLKKLRDEFAPIFIRRGSIGPALRELGRKLLSQIEATSEHHFIVCIGDLSRSKIATAIPSLRWEPEAESFVIQFEVSPSYWDNLERDVVRNQYLHLIKGIQSFPEFEAELKSLTQELPARKQSS